MSTLAYIHWAPDPTLLDLGFYQIQWYSTFFAAGFIISFIILQKQFKKAGLPLELLEKLTVYIVLATIIGARLGHCLFYDWAYFKHHLLEIILPVEFSPHFRITGYRGLASHGGALGIFIALWLFTRKYKTPLLWLTDKLALVVPLAGACIRLGNLMNSEIIGKPADVPWAFIFSRVDGIPRHPGQLYEAIGYLLLFALMWILKPRLELKRGQLFGLFLTVLFAIRFIVEYFKEDQVAFEQGMALNMGQLLSIPFILGGIVLMVWAGRQPDSPLVLGKVKK